MHIGEIITRNARRYPEKTAVVFETTRYTFREFNNRVNSLANALSDMGVRKGDRVAILADNCAQYPEIYCAGPKGGMVVVPLNTRLTGGELSYIMNNSEANTLILGENYLELVNSIRPELSTVDRFVIIGVPSGEMRSYEGLVSMYPSDEPKVEIQEDDVIYIMYTAGTTGLPKGVIHTHKSMIALAQNILLSWRLAHEDVTLMAYPAYYFGLLWLMTPHFYVGASVVVIKEFVPEIVLQAIEEERVTDTIFAIPMLVPLLEYPDLSKYDISSLRLISTAGGAVPAEISKRVTEFFGNIFTQVYGLTEATPLTFLPQEEYFALEGGEVKVKRPGSCGREVVNVEVRVVDEEGNDVAPGEVGEIIARGESVMKGYWKQPEATKAALRGGYFYTGDMGTMDEEGYIYLMDRKKDVIISGGESIYSPEVEDVLYSHPSILEAAVIGVPDEKLGERVRAVIVLREGKKATEEEIVEFCKQKLAGYKIPKSVGFIDKLPKSPVGKILKRVLREE